MNNKNKILLALMALTLGGTSQANDVAEFEMNLPAGSYNIENQKPAQKALVELDYNLGGTSIRYVSYAASAMKTLGTGTFEKDYFGAGCVDDDQDAASGLALDDYIDIPQGSRIVSATFLGRDTSNTLSFTGRFWAFTGGAANLVTSGNSGGTFDGGNIAPGGFLSYETDVDTLYAVRLEAPSSNGALRLCGVRIGYIPEDIAGDVIFASNFFR